MNTKQEALEVVIGELERNLASLEAGYQSAVANLNALRKCVDKDDLTRLLRRGAFMRELHNLLYKSKLEGCEVSLMMIDLDHFKRVNDTYGHQTGDVVLERVSQLIKQFMRPQDLAGRYGGEEIIVAVQAGAIEVEEIAENIRKAVEAHRMVSVSAIQFNVTLSMGVASTQEFKFGADVLNVLIREADAALYRAKDTGRNKVVKAELKIAPVFNIVEAMAA